MSWSTVPGHASPTTPKNRSHAAVMPTTSAIARYRAASLSLL